MASITPPEVPVPAGWATPAKRAEILAGRITMSEHSIYIDLIDYIESLEKSNQALVTANAVVSAKLAAAELAAANLARAAGADRC